MNINFIGIDISNNTFDVCFSQMGKQRHYEFDKSKTGFSKLFKTIPKNSHCVMEATGPYYLKLATFLFDKGLPVSVENPLKIKRFMQMNLQRTKTDKADARAIANYGSLLNPPLWKPEESWVLGLRQKQATIELMQKTANALKNQIEAFTKCTHISRLTITELKKNIRSLDLSQKKMESEIERILKVEAKRLYEKLRSIPSLGPKAVSTLIVITNGFKKFESAKQLQCYIGLCPRIYQSGTSVKGKGHINKMGMGRMRKILYMCALSAIKRNTQCKAQYERLCQAGKPKMVAIIAVANKLVRQAFAIGKGEVNYDERRGMGLAF